MKNEHAILRLCQELEVSASGYYDWQTRRVCPGLRAVEDQALVQEIEHLHIALHGSNKSCASKDAAMDATALPG